MLYPFAFIHISFVPYQHLVYIVRSMLFNVADHYEKLAGGFNKLPVIK